MSSTAVMMERTGMSMPGVGVPGMGMGTPAVSAPTSSPVSNYLMVPRGQIKLEKCTGGMKINCSCDDKMACSMVQNLCTMLAGGMCSCCVMMNGMPVCSFNLTMGMCKCEMTDTGVCITCTSGDEHCCEMIQACCNCVTCMMEAGCSCFVMMNNTPVCCCACVSGVSGSKSKASR